MGKAICLGTSMEGLSLEEQFGLYKQAGFDGIEIPIEEDNGPLSLKSSLF